jgi:heat shock protein 5
MRNTIEDKDKLADKLDEDDKSTISDALTDAEDWLNQNDEADKDDYDEQMKELQRICDPIIAQIYQQ